MMLKSKALLCCLTLGIWTGIYSQSSQLQLILPTVDLGCIDDLTTLPKPDPAGIEGKTTCAKKTLIVRHIDDILSIAMCQSKLHRIYEVTDLCGQSKRDTQEYRFVYDTFPEPDNELVIYVDLGCNPEIEDAIPNPRELTLPICDAKIDWIGDNKDKRECFHSITRKYEVTSCKGTFIYILVYNWIEDHEPPTILCPESVHFGCEYSGVPAPDPSRIRVEDNCCIDSVFWGSDIIVSAFDTCEHTLIRRYWAIDCCGNTSYCDQVFQWYSFPQPPEIISCPEGANLGCNIDLKSDLPPATPKLVQVKETCGEIQVDAHLSDITINGREYSISWVYIATDECGNSSQCLQTYTWIVDTEIPYINKCPSDIDLGCNPDKKELGLVSPDFGIEAYDNCGIKSIKKVSTSEVQNGHHCEKHYLITYAVEDHCGNVATCEQKVFWTEDTVPPSIQCPPDLDLGCNPSIIPEPDPSQVIAEDNCCLEEVTWLIDVIVTSTSCEQQRIRKYQAVDCCGNISICEQKITWISDLTPPIITGCPSGWDLGCNIDVENDLPPATPELILAEDNCSNIMVTSSLSDITIFGCQYSITRIYTVADECGNEEQCFQTFTWTVDNEPPVIRRCPEDLDLGCNPTEREPFLTSPDFGIEADDNCGIKSIKKVAVSEIQDGEDCIKFYHIVYEVSDFCGNTATCKQRVFWREDMTPPTIICPPDLNLGCAPVVVPAPDPTMVEAFDNCGIANVAMTASSISNENGFIKITRTYTATDQCGNQTSCDQMISYHEIGISIFVQCPEDVDFGCVGEMPIIPDPEPNEISDGPCQVEKQYVGDDLQLVNPCEYVWTRTYLFITCCNDTIPCFQTFKWRIVNTDSIIDIPEDFTSFCKMPPMPDFVQQGLCGPGIPIFDGQDIIGDCENGNCTIKRYWKKTGCQGGFSIYDVQTIEVKCDLTYELNTEIENPRRSMELKLWPNPATDYLSLDISRPQAVTSIIIVDMQGRKVLHIPVDLTVEKYQIEIGDLTPGIYQLRIQGDETITERFIKM